MLSPKPRSCPDVSRGDCLRFHLAEPSVTSRDRKTTAPGTEPPPQRCEAPGVAWGRGGGEAGGGGMGGWGVVGDRGEGPGGVGGVGWGALVAAPTQQLSVHEV